MNLSEAIHIVETIDPGKLIFSERVAIRMLLNQARWRKVEDELPEKDGRYLAEVEVDSEPESDDDSIDGLTVAGYINGTWVSGTRVLRWRPIYR